MQLARWTLALTLSGLIVGPVWAQNQARGQAKAPLVLASQGSFFVGGETKTLPAPASGPGAGAAAGEITVNQMYVQYQVPPNGNQHVPVVMVHGCCLSSKTWETTPDGRMGWSEYFVRKDRPVYLADQVSRARSGFDATTIAAVKAGTIPPSQLSNSMRLDSRTACSEFFSWTIRRVYARSRHSCATLALGRVREPGLLSSYSNYDVALAGAALAHVANASWQDIIDQQILRPLQLTHISVREPYPPREGLPAPMPDTQARDLSRGFRWGGISHAMRKFECITHTAPAGIMSASAGDMARYMLMLLNDGSLEGTTIFGPRAAAAFRTPMTSTPREVGALDAGFFESPLPGGFRGFGHGGGTLSFFSNMMIVPELGLGIFVATNTEGGAQLSEPLPANIVERFYAPPRRPPAPGKSDAVAARVYAGQYLTTRRPYRGLEGSSFVSKPHLSRCRGTAIWKSP
jgi:hypothetical protein